MRISRLFADENFNGADFSRFMPYEAAEALKAAYFPDAPKALSPIEENTVPSWLWRKNQKSTGVVPEHDAQQVFDRIVGAATYAGWKKDVFTDEVDARSFYEDMRFMFANRMIGMKPAAMQRLGTDWSYGIHATRLESAPSSAKTTQALNISNETIDALLDNKTVSLKTEWHKFLRNGAKHQTIAVHFSDTKSEWSSFENPAPQLMLDLMQFRRDDGSLDVTFLRHTVKLSVIFLDLHFGAQALAIGYGNLAALLMTQSIPYDGKAGRAMAAAISAIITAEATTTSAMLAGMFGVYPAYAMERESKLRTLRNQRRAAYNERNDYEHLSILPETLEIERGVDLVLIATARRCWDEAVVAVQENGLRHAQLTVLFNDADFASLLGVTTQGVEPEPQLVLENSASPEDYQRVIHPAVPLALEKIGCDVADVKAIIDHIVGYNTLVAAPGISHIALSKKGFDPDALTRLEAYLPRVKNIRHAFTPWILGEKFCRTQLKLTDKQIFDPVFDLLSYLGFSEEAIAKANLFCCGHGTIHGVSELSASVASIFVTGDKEAHLRMAAAVQGFIGGDVGLSLWIDASTSMEAQTAIILNAWRKGLRSISLKGEGILYDSTHNVSSRMTARKKILKYKALPTRAPIPSFTGKKISAQMTSPRGANSTNTSTRLVSLKTKEKKPRHSGH